MSQTIQISEKSAALLSQQAAAHGKSLEAWVEELAIEKAQSNGTTRNAETRAAAEGILELQKNVKPDPEGWTIRDYITAAARSRPPLDGSPGNRRIAGSSVVLSPTNILNTLMVFLGSWLRSGVPLASLDNALCKAAVKAGVVLFGR